jgi:flagellar FliJ protein
MRKFKFSLEKLLEHRRMQVDLAQRDYLTAKSKEDEQVSRMQFMQTELNSAIQTTQQLQRTGGTVADQIQAIHEFCGGQKIRIGRQNRMVLALREISEHKRLVLVEAMKQVKTLEKLREKKKFDFDKELLRLEMKEVDEMNVMRHGRREII